MDPEQAYADATAIRNDVADLLAALDDEGLRTPSLCSGWDVLTVGAHLAVSVTVPFTSFMATVIRHGGNVHRANERLARQLARRPPAEVIRLLRENADRRLSPPRSGPVAPLTEAMVHAGDICRPLGLVHRAPAESVRAGLSFLVDSRPLGIVTRRRLTDLAFTADDIPVVVGSGQQIRGSGIDLLMAAAGRLATLAALTGPGADVLRARVAAGLSAG